MTGRAPFCFLSSDYVARRSSVLLTISGVVSFVIHTPRANAVSSSPMPAPAYTANGKSSAESFSTTSVACDTALFHNRIATNKATCSAVKVGTDLLI
jgi:hypothetical protein